MHNVCFLLHRCILNNQYVGRRHENRRNKTKRNRLKSIEQTTVFMATIFFQKHACVGSLFTPYKKLPLVFAENYGLTIDASVLTSVRPMSARQK